MKKKKKSILIAEIAASIVLLAVLITGGNQLYRLIGNNFMSIDGESRTIYVYPETRFEDLLTTLEGEYSIGSIRSLRLHAKLMKWPSAERPFVRTGHYVLPAEMCNIELIRTFRSGNQTPISLTFNNIRTAEQLAGRLAEQLMLDSADVISRLQDSAYMSAFGLTPPTAVCLFLPDTYETWWDISPDQLFKKMKQTYDAFWSPERLEKARKLGLQPWEVTTIASIVEGETNRDEDKPIIAGLYQNRLRIGMPLQSDPTVKFAVGDFNLRRITNAHLAVESPYNTYKYAGLPPGPIRIPTKKTIDFTLNPTPSNYLYMCASERLDGTHNFTASYAAHLNNARAYQQELNRRKIFK